MRKFVILFVAFGLWFLISPTGVLAQSATLSLDPASGTFNRSCSFAINVNLDTGGAQTDGTDAILFYDVSRLTATSITNGTIYPDYPGNNIDPQGGKITISGLASVNTPFTGKGTVATVNFKVNDTAATGATQITFDFDPNNKAKTTDSNVVERNTVVDVLNSVVNGGYTIGSGTCGAQPQPSSTPGTIVPIPPIGGPGPIVTATPSAQPIYKELPPAGSADLTFMLAIIGGTLTVLGILGLALL